MFIINQDYNIISNDVPVLTRQENGRFEFTDCYFIELAIRPDDKTIEKIMTMCEPFDYSTAIKHLISKYIFVPGNIQRLFMLLGHGAIKNDFKHTDDFLAIASCADAHKKTTIQYFEVNYNFRHSYDPNQKYNRVGTSALDALKEVYKDHELCGRSALEALGFWLKNGFTRMDDRDLYVHWRQR